ncbi:MaoC family dehydratase [Natrinema gelatinilyticum]|uniref:MaoC family dehydratase n=1 Tax=Natrinema gelatinilyticum TaxID=2961571 RepID=UPI0020C1CB7C|nr:MaoC/PaaZ C-terminal domain-containing protein [Natrinema gelatinilyticum]
MTRVLEVGETVVERTFEVDPAGMQLLTAILRDPNPIHYDREYATQRGYPGRVNQGPINAEYVAQAALEVAESPAGLRSLDVQYEDFVFESETVTAIGTVADMDRSDATVELVLELRADDGTVAVTGQAVVDVDQDWLPVASGN